MRLNRPNFLLNNKQHRGIMRLVTLLILAVMVIGAGLTFLSEKELKKASGEFEEKITQTWRDDYKVFESFQEHLAKDIFNQLVEETEMAEYVDAFIQASSSEEKALKRQALLAECQVIYDRHQVHGLKHLQFHTPESSSILRMSHPDQFGDSLKGLRPSVELANDSKKGVHGLEKGRVFIGFCYVWPILHNGRHVGSVEFGFPTDSLVHFMEGTFPRRRYLFRMGTSVGQKPVGNELLGPASKEEQKALTEQINSFLAKWHNVKTLEIQQLRGEDGFYILYLQPVLNVRREPVAALISLEPGNGIGRVKNIRSIMLNMGWLGVIFVGSLAGIIWYLSSSVKHQKIDHLQQIEKLVGNLPGMICQWHYFPETGKSCIPFSSSGIQSLFGLQPEEVREDTSRLFNVIHPEDAVSVATSLRECSLSRKSWICECRVCLEGKKDSWVSISGTPEVQGDGSILWHAYIMDTTERKLEREKLNQANKKLEEANEKSWTLAQESKRSNEVKSQFLANMSHDIRTPINGVLGLTEVLLETELDEEQHLFVQTIRNSGEALRNLVNDILDISKIEADKLEIDHTDFSLNELMDDFSVSMSLECQRKDIEFVSSVDLDIGDALRGDPFRIRQILSNLCGNAIKFTSEGQVVVRVSRLEETESELLLRISVEDSGIGIPEEKQDLLFKNFSQMDPSIARKYGGTGLGLAISKKLASLMGGDIGFSSFAGKGSRFWVIINLEKQSSYSVPDSYRVPSLEGKKVLMSVKNAPTRDVLTRWLDALGMETCFVPDGFSVIDRLKDDMDDNNPVDLLLLGQEIQGMDMNTMARFFYSKWGTRGIKLLLVAPLTGKNQELSEIPTNNVDWITKPINLRKLRVAISAFFGSE